MGSKLHVPEELVIDILLRLPAKSLSRFKCVSKNWCGLIENKSFVEKHYGRESNRERLLICLAKQEGVNHAFNDDDDNGDEEEEEEEEIVMGPWIPPPPPQEQIDDDYALFLAREILVDQINVNRYLNRAMRLPTIVCSYKCALYVDETFSEYEDPAHLQINPDDEGDTVVFGPLNGVFCVVSCFPWGPMALLNPALRQFKPLPLVEHVDPADRHRCINELGFGLDPLTGEYKLVVIIQLVGQNMNIMDGQINECIALVCYSDSDSWKVVDDVDLFCLSRRAHRSLCNTYLNGAYYWLLNSSKSTDPVAILAFDMGTDKFRTIQVTGCDPHREQGYLALSGDTLALLMYDGFEHNGSRFINVWKMENEGCWIKSVRVGPLEGSFARPLCFWTKNELLYESRPTFLAQCNVSTGELKTFEAKMTDQDRFTRWVCVYKESLVSIKGKAGKCKLWDPSSDFVKDFFKDPSTQNVA